MLESLNQDSEIADLIKRERERLEEGLELIPSENYVSGAVRAALGSVLTNKYSEGYPGKRYYGGNKYIDEIENLAISRAKLLFGAEHVNVQPYSGSPANLEVFFAALNSGDKAMGMNLAHGGHLTHGHTVNFSGSHYNFIRYGVDKDTERLDYDKIRALALAEKPKIIISGATAYPRTINFKEFRDIATEVNAISMADVSHIAGLIVSDLHPSPLPFTDIVTTTTHKTLRGPRGAMIMCKKAYAQKIDRAVFPGMQGGPHNHTTAAMAIAFREALRDDFKAYAHQIVKNAKTLAVELQAQGLKLVTDGTDNHLILVDLTNCGCSGKVAETALSETNITVNKNMIPFDKRTPFDPSGIRVGTPAITTRGMGKNEMIEIGQMIAKVIKNYADKNVKEKVKQQVLELCGQFKLE